MRVRAGLAAVLMAASTAAASAAGGHEPEVSVRHAGPGVYAIAARFHIAEPAALVRAVLTDYQDIPRFMPGVRLSRVLDRRDARVRVEQEAVSKFMMFSRTVHLLLDVDEGREVIRFRDACGRSFERYEGSWTLTETDRGTEVLYELTAKPAFSVPGAVLRRLLDRDAREMIEGLRAEIRRR